MRTKCVPTVKEILYQDIKGKSHREISKSLAVSRNTIKGYYDLAVSFGYSKLSSDEELERISLKVHDAVYLKARNRHKPSIEAIKPFHEDIEGYLKSPWITHIQIHRLLKEKGLKSSPRSLTRYISQYFPKLSSSTVHLETIAGDEGQVDYGYVGMLNNRKIYAFVMTLSHSRYRYVEFVHSQDAVSWAQSHINAFKFFGAVPKSVLLDNLKSGVISADIYDPVINQTYAELERHFGFVADPAKARTPEHKGKVERSVRIVKEQVIAGRKFNDLQGLNSFALNWCKNVIANEVCSTTGRTPADLFKKEELPAMLSLPSEEFDMPAWTIAKVHKNHHITVRGNFYSLPTEYIGEEVQVRVGLKTVRAYKDHKIITTHIKETGKGKWVTNQDHYPEHVAYYLAQGSDDCLDSAKEIGEACFELMQEIVKPKSKTAIRKAQAILRLQDQYTPERLENACLRSISYDNYEFKSVANILRKGLDDKTTESFSVRKSPDNSYLRPPTEYSSSMEVNYG